MAPIVLIALGAIPFLFALSNKTGSKQTPVAANADPLKSLPNGMTGAAANAGTKVKNGRKYTVTVWPVQKDGRQFAIARLQGSTAWVSYWHTVDKSKPRKLYRAFAPGNKQQAGVVVSTMMGDWAVKN